MARKKKAKHEIQPDPFYGNTQVAKFINHVMRRGKKTVARKIVYRAFTIMKEKTSKEPVEVFDSAIRNVAPVLEVRSRRIGGASYQVPVEVNPEKRVSLAMRWIINAARSKKGKPMHEKLAQEFLDAANNTGAAVKKRDDMHRMAEANRAFAHFAW